MCISFFAVEGTRITTGFLQKGPEDKQNYKKPPPGPHLQPPALDVRRRAAAASPQRLGTGRSPSAEREVDVLDP